MSYRSVRPGVYSVLTAALKLGQLASFSPLKTNTNFGVVARCSSRFYKDLPICGSALLNAETWCDRGLMRTHRAGILTPFLFLLRFCAFFYREVYLKLSTDTMPVENYAPHGPTNTEGHSILFLVIITNYGLSENKR